MRKKIKLALTLFFIASILFFIILNWKLILTVLTSFFLYLWLKFVM